MKGGAAVQGTAGQGGGARLWWLGLLCGGLATLATPTAALAGLLLAPSGAAWLADRSPGKLAVRPVLLCGLAAAIGPLAALWTGGHTLALALSLASDVQGLGIAWGAQAAGWLAGELAPLAVLLGVEAAAAARAAALRARRRALQDEWGLPDAE